MRDMGRYGDTEIAHVAPGEVVIPGEILQANPMIRQIIEVIFDQAGMDFDRYQVSSGANSINPQTGAQEFYADQDSERDESGMQAGAQMEENDRQVDYGGQDGGGGGGGLSPSQYKSAMSSGSFGGMSRAAFEAAFGPPVDPSADARGTQAQRGLYNSGAGKGTGNYADVDGVDRTPDPSADVRGTQAQRGLYNAGAGKGGIPEKDFLDEVLSFFGINKRYDPVKGPMGTTTPYKYDEHWGLDFNPVGMAVGAATGPLGLVLGPATSYLTGKAGAPTVGLDKNGVGFNRGGWFDGDLGFNPDPSYGGLADDGAPFGGSPAQMEALQEQIQAAFSPPPIAENPSWLTYPEGMSNRQKRSYLATNALYGDNGNFRSDETFDLLSSMLQNAAYTSGGEQRALEDFLLPVERSYLSRRGVTPSNTQQLLAAL